MKNDEVEIYLEMKLDGERFGKRADLFTDGVDEFWIPHSQIIEKTHIKDRDYNVIITEWIAKQKGII
jgi:hypothetical protein